MNSLKERRFLSLNEDRSGLMELDQSRNTLAGTAIVYNSLSENMDGFREQFAPGSLHFDDLRVLINHDDSLILGRLNAGTMRVHDSPSGFRFECDLPDTSYARDLRVSLQRKDISGCSFGFICDKDSWQMQGGIAVRTVHAATLLEVSVCTFPAYPQTEAALRGLDHFKIASECVEQMRRKRDRFQKWLRVQ